MNLDIELDKMDDYNGDKNLYRELIVNDASKIESTLISDGTVVNP